LGGKWGKRGDALWFVAPAADPLRAPEIVAACRRARELGARELTVLAWEWDDHDPRSLREHALSEDRVALSLRTIPMDLARGKPRQPTFAERAELDLELVAAPHAPAWAVRLRGLRGPQTIHEIDAWRVDYRRVEETFSPIWEATRDRDRLETMTPFFPRDEGGTVTARAFMVFGEEITTSLRVE
jgi:hypothetical protein